MRCGRVFLFFSFLNVYFDLVLILWFCFPYWLFDILVRGLMYFALIFEGFDLGHLKITTRLISDISHVCSEDQPS